MTERVTSIDELQPRDAERPGGALRRQLLYAVPAIGFAGFAGALALGLGRDPSKLPSPLIGKAVPIFSLSPVQGRTLGLASNDLHGEISLVNVFASWCVACRAEHPLFMQMARTKTLTVHGLNYKDRPEDAARWLDTLGDPYTRTGADRDGRVAIDFGVYGVPETFVIGADGRIAYKHIGPISEQALAEAILPLIARLRAQTMGGGS